MNPFFSIIVPAYNAQNTIVRALISLVSQTFTNIEILVIDGLSADYTVPVVKNIAENESRITVISEKDEGIYDAMNKGIRLAKGEWLYFMGADDELYDNDVLNKVAANEGLSTFNVAYGDVEIVGDTSWSKNGHRYDGIFDLKKILERNICHQALFYRRRFIVDQIGYYNQKYKLLADWDFNLRCFARTGFLFLDEIIAKFFGGGESTAKTRDNPFDSDLLSIIFHNFNMSLYDPVINHLAFSHYHEVLKLQRKDNPIKYFARRIRSRLFTQTDT